jgi:hypothetical protein
MTVKGSCACGALKYEVDAEPPYQKVNMSFLREVAYHIRTIDILTQTNTGSMPLRQLPKAHRYIL